MSSTNALKDVAEILNGIKAIPKLAEQGSKITRGRVAAGVLGGGTVAGVGAGATSHKLGRQSKTTTEGAPAMGQLAAVKKSLAGTAHAADLGLELARRKGMSEGKALAAVGAGSVGLIAGGEVAGRKVGGARYRAGKHVNDGFFMGPSVNRGYFAAERKAKGKVYGSARPGGLDPEAGQAVRKADRDQNSSIGTTITLQRPKGDGVKPTTTAQTRSGSFAGKTRGVGRHLGRDQNSSPGSAVVRTPTLRQINGRFAGEGPGVKVFHPVKGSVRGAVHTKQLFRGTKKPELLEKRDSEPRKGMLGPVDLLSMTPHTQARVGRRL